MPTRYRSAVARSISSMYFSNERTVSTTTSTPLPMQSATCASISIAAFRFASGIDGSAASNSRVRTSAFRVISPGPDDRLDDAFFHERGSARAVRSGDNPEPGHRFSVLRPCPPFGGRPGGVVIDRGQVAVRPDFDGNIAQSSGNREAGGMRFQHSLPCRFGEAIAQLTRHHIFGLNLPRTRVRRCSGRGIRARRPVRSPRSLRCL